jgi:cyclopropane-fatty-acyl-phospholipid synthase
MPTDTRTRSTAETLKSLVENLLQAPLPIRVRAWDGSVAGPPGTPTLVVRHRRAIRRLMWRPDELGLARAYVAGELDVDGDVYDALDRLRGLLWRTSDAAAVPVRAVAGDLLRLGALGPAPKPPPEEIALTGARHSRSRDRRAVTHHYDVGNDFYRLVLGPSMVYSCAYWSGADDDLAVAQRAKLDLICRKLDLRPGTRLLDVGCGWGALAVHAAREYGAEVVGVTLSGEQADVARKQVAEAGLTDQVEIRVQDYRDLDDPPYDAISSIGMAEHVGTGPYAAYAAVLFRHLRAGGRLLNHQIAALHPAPQSTRPQRSFIDAYVFPDGEMAPLGTTVSLLEAAGFEVRDVQVLREHYARTLRAWVANLDAEWSRAARLAGAGRARVWRLYMAGSALSFEHGRLGVNQVLAVRAHRSGASDMPATRAEWPA